MAARKASGRVPPPTPAPRSFSRRSTPRARTPTTPAPATPSSTRWSPDSYDLAKLFESSPKAASSRTKTKTKAGPTAPNAKAGPTTPKAKAEPTPSKAGVLTGYTKTVGVCRNAKVKTKPTVTVYADDKTLGLVRGRPLLAQDVDSPIAESARSQSGWRPRSPKSPTSSGRADPECKLLRRNKSYMLVCSSLGVLLRISSDACSRSIFSLRLQ